MPASSQGTRLKLSLAMSPLATLELSIQAIVRRSPSAKSTLGSYPISSRASDTSAWLIATSPGRSGPCTGRIEVPSSSFRRSTSSSSECESPIATFITTPAAPGAEAAARFASTTLSMCVKSRAVWPSPLIVGASAASIWWMNFGITAA